MEVLVVYDTIFGNTEMLAKAIGESIGAGTRVVRAGDINPASLGHLDLLVVGAPTQGGRPTQPVQNFLAGLTEVSIKGVKVAAFDTRYSGRFVKIFGFAAERIAEDLTQKGGILAAPPEGFIVTGKKGPLKEGELARVAPWAKGLVK